jgi:hypothetical protein
VAVAVQAVQGQLLQVLLAVAMVVLVGLEAQQFLAAAAAQADMLAMEARLGLLVLEAAQVAVVRETLIPVAVAVAWAFLVKAQMVLLEQVHLAAAAQGQVALLVFLAFIPVLAGNTAVVAVAVMQLLVMAGPVGAVQFVLFGLAIPLLHAPSPQLMW